MPEEKPSAPATPPPTSPAIERLRVQVEQARLEKELAEQGASRAKALVGDWSGVTASTDSVTVSKDDSLGLADVYVSRAAVNVADDIADLAWSALNQRRISNAQVLVVGGPGVIADCDTYRVLRSSLRQLTDRLRATSTAAEAPAQDLPEGRRGTVHLMAALPAVIPALTTALPAVAGVVSKLLARAYTVSGKPSGGLDDLGFDLLLANEVLRRATTATVRVGRLVPVQSTELFEEVRDLAMALQGPLAARLAVAEAGLALHAERAKQAQANLDAARSQITELVKLLTAEDDVAGSPALAELKATREEADTVRAELLRLRTQPPPKEADGQAAQSERVKDLEEQLKALRDQTVKAVAALSGVDDTGGVTPRVEALERAMRTEEHEVEQLPALRAHETAAEAVRLELQHTHDDGLGFLAEILTVDSDEPPPLVRAGRVESLVDDDQTEPHVILMARVLRAGVDRVLATKVGPDRQSVLAGLTVEWALLRPSGELLDCGVRTGLRATEGTVGKLSALEETDVLYVGVPRKTEDRPPGASASSG